jgi:hypothetical protein
MVGKHQFLLIRAPNSMMLLVNFNINENILTKERVTDSNVQAQATVILSLITASQ